MRMDNYVIIFLHSETITNNIGQDEKSVRNSFSLAEDVANRF